MFVKEWRGLLGVSVPEVPSGSDDSVRVSRCVESAALDDLADLLDLCRGDEGVTVIVPVKGVRAPDSGERVYVRA